MQEMMHSLSIIMRAFLQKDADMKKKYIIRLIILCTVGIILIGCSTACSFMKKDVSTATVVDFDTSETETVEVNGRYSQRSERKTNFYIFLKYDNGIVKYCVPISIYDKFKIGDKVEVTRMSNISEHGYIYWIDDVQIEYCCTLKEWEKTPHEHEIE